MCFGLTLLLVVTAFLLLPTGKVQAVQLDHSLRFGYNQLSTPSQKRVYELLEVQLETVSEHFIVPSSENATCDDYFDAAKQLVLDRPDLFYFDGSGLVIELRDGRLAVYPQYALGKNATPLPTFHEALAQLGATLSDLGGSTQMDLHRSGYGDITIDQILSAKQTYEQQVQDILGSIPASASTQEAKVKYIHDHLARRIEYVKGDNDQNSYSAIVERKSVCAGYAKSFQDLLNRLGIRCWYITGYSGLPHAWNVLWLNGECVYTDVTWADQTHYIRYGYYNISREQMSLDHDMDPEYEAALGSCNHERHRHTLTPENAADSLCRVEEEAMFTGNRLHLDYTALGQNIQFFSSDPAVATVDANGLITAVAPGTAEVLTLIHDDGVAMKLCITVSSRPHTHSLQAVPEAPAGCTASGQKAHYVCTGCGQLFSDGAGLQATNTAALQIAPAGHNAGSWSHDENIHWRSCTRCGEKLTEDSAAHADSNSDDKCDVCQCVLTVPTVPSTTAPSTTVPSTPTVPTTTPTTLPTGTAPSVPPIVPTTLPSPTVPNQVTGTAGKEPEATACTTPDRQPQTGETGISNVKDADPGNPMLIVLCTAVAVSVMAAAFLIWWKLRKKS